MRAKRVTGPQDTSRMVIVGAAPRVPKETTASRTAFKRADEKIAAFKKSVSKKK